MQPSVHNAEKAFDTNAECEVINVGGFSDFCFCSQHF